MITDRKLAVDWNMISGASQKRIRAYSSRDRHSLLVLVGQMFSATPQHSMLWVRFFKRDGNIPCRDWLLNSG